MSVQETVSETLSNLQKLSAAIGYELNHRSFSKKDKNLLIEAAITFNYFVLLVGRISSRTSLLPQHVDRLWDLAISMERHFPDVIREETRSEPLSFYEVSQLHYAVSIVIEELHQPLPLRQRVGASFKQVLTRIAENLSRSLRRSLA